MTDSPHDSNIALLHENIFRSILFFKKKEKEKGDRNIGLVRGQLPRPEECKKKKVDLENIHLRRQ